MQLGNRELLGTARHQLRPLLRHNSGDDPDPLQQFDPHSIARVELLPLIAGFGIVHSAVRQDAVEISREQTDLLKDMARDLPGSSSFFRCGSSCHRVNSRYDVLAYY